MTNFLILILSTSRLHAAVSVKITPSFILIHAKPGEQGMDSRLRKAFDAIDHAVDGMDAAALAAPPAPGKWSAAQILEHLALSYQLTTKGMSRILEMGHAAATRSSLGQRVGAFAVLKLGYLPRGRKSPERVLPRGAVPPAEAVETIRRSLTEMDAALTRAAERFGKTVKLADHPVLGPFTVEQWRQFHLVHCLHHMKQVRALKKRFAPASHTASAS